MPARVLARAKSAARGEIGLGDLPVPWISPSLLQRDPVSIARLSASLTVLQCFPLSARGRSRGAGHSAPGTLHCGHNNPQRRHPGPAPVSPFNFITMTAFSPGSRNRLSDHRSRASGSRSPDIALERACSARPLFSCPHVVLIFARGKTWTSRLRDVVCWDESRSHP